MNQPNCIEPITENTQACPSSDVTQENKPQQTPDLPKQENVATGIVGALLGALLGCGAILLLNQLGYIASISGFILAVCTFKGYELLGRRLSWKGIVICLALILVTPYMADRMNWAISIVQQFPEVSFAEAFQTVHETIALNDLESEYVTDLLILYGFTVLGAFSTVRDLFKKK